MKQILIEKYLAPHEITPLDGEYWCDNSGYYHSFMGQPAMVYYSFDNLVSIQCWAKNGSIHRDKDLPAKIYYKNGKAIEKVWYKKGVKHRNGDKPAQIAYDENGKMLYEKYYKNGTEVKFIELKITIGKL
jgi:hypothetical protein